MTGWEKFRTGLEEDASARGDWTAEQNIRLVADQTEAEMLSTTILWEHDDITLACANFEDGSLGYVAIGYNVTGEVEWDDCEIIPVDDPIKWLEAQAAGLHKQARQCRDAAHAALHTIGCVKMMEGKDEQSA